MDLVLNLEEDEVEYLETEGIIGSLTDTLERALKHVATVKSADPLLTLSEEISTLSSHNRTMVQGLPVSCCPSVFLTVGPVIGEVTHKKAIILLEVKDQDRPRAEVTCHLYKRGTYEEVHSITIPMPFQTPRVFVFDEPDCELEPATEYITVFSGLRREDSWRSFGLFKTKQLPEEMEKFKIIALSCDRPDRLLLGQKNPWYELARKTEFTDVMLHLGDQVYNKGEDNDNTQKLFDREYEGLSAAHKERMKKRARALLRKKYRECWNKSKTRECLQKGSHLMIWSDNDVANDFTTMKDHEGNQAYPPAFLQCGIEVYRQYQRILWDPSIQECRHSKMPAEEEFFQEYHSHVYGPVGIFLFDMRGNRITGDGIQHSENPIISEEQWDAIEEFFQTEGLQVIILASEIPFVGDDPASIQEKVLKVDFLKDHWPYNVQDLIRILDMSFKFKGEDEDNREVLLLGGDIHCGVSSVIRDNETDLTLNHLTTSPITNHVTEFFPETHGEINDRYSYDHIALGRNQRNYAEISITLKPTFSVTAQLKAISTNMYRVTDWMSDEEEEDEE